MNINQINGVNLNSYSPNVKQTEHFEKVQNVQKQVQKKLDENVNVSKNASNYLDTLKKKFDGYDFKVVSKEEMEKIKDDPSMYSNASSPTVFIDEEELEKMATDPEYAAKQEKVLKETSEKLPEIKNELDKKGANVVSMGFIIENGKVSLFTELQKPKKEDEIQKLNEREREKVQNRQQERIREIRKKYEPVKRPSDDTTIIKRDDTITIITDSFMDLSAAIGDFGRDYYFKQDSAGVNVDVSL